MIALCSGGFSILHIGHLDYFKQAAQYGNVVVALNSDAWLKRKYGLIVVPWEERRVILMALKVISDVVPVDDADDTVCEAIKRIRPNFFVNGGDRVKSNPQEHLSCLESGTKEIFVRTVPVHSSELIRKLRL